MKTLIVNGYYVAGNDYVAIAISVTDEEDSHYFYYLDNGLNAFDSAVAWTSPGI